MSIKHPFDQDTHS